MKTPDPVIHHVVYCLCVRVCIRHCFLHTFISLIPTPSSQKGFCGEQIHPKNGQGRFHHAQFSGNVSQDCCAISIVLMLQVYMHWALRNTSQKCHSLDGFSSLHLKKSQEISSYKKKKKQLKPDHLAPQFKSLHSNEVDEVYRHNIMHCTAATRMAD